MNKDMLLSYLNKFDKVRTLVIGDIMLDRFLYGSVERISPEAPVPILKFSNEKQMLGGAGNVVANLRALGVDATFMGIIGNDDNGKKISSLFYDLDIKNHLLKVDAIPTIVKTRIIAGNHHLLRVDCEEKLPIITEFLPKFKKILIQAIKNTDVVLLSDYNKGLLTNITCPMIIDICKELQVPVIVDPKGFDYSKYQNATLVKPNLKEFSEATGTKYNLNSEQFNSEIKHGASYLIDRFNIDNLLITLSEYGMIFLSSDDIEHVIRIPTEAKEVFDVSGAGDTSLAVLGVCIGAKIPMSDAMKLANIASGIVVGKVGTATVTVKEIKEYLHLKSL